MNGGEGPAPGPTLPCNLGPITSLNAAFSSPEKRAKISYSDFETWLQKSWMLPPKGGSVSPALESGQGSDCSTQQSTTEVRLRDF